MSDALARDLTFVPIYVGLIVAASMVYIFWATYDSKYRRWSLVPAFCAAFLLGLGAWKFTDTLLEVLSV